MELWGLKLLDYFFQISIRFILVLMTLSKIAVIYKKVNFVIIACHKLIGWAVINFAERNWELGANLELWGTGNWAQTLNCELHSNAAIG